MINTNNLKDPTSPIDLTTHPSRPASTPNRRRILAIAIVVVVVVTGAVSTVLLVSNHSTSAPRVALVDGSTVTGLTNQQLITSYSNESAGSYSQNVTEYETIVFNTTSASGTVLGTLAIQSLEFSSSSSSLSFCNQLYSVGVQDYKVVNSSFSINVQNISYDRFSFSYLLLNHTYTIQNITNIYSLYVVGHSGSFAFVIVDLNVQLSSYTTLIHDEIQAMMG